MNNDRPYQKVYIDVEADLPQVEVAAGHYGVAVFLRRRGAPIGYFQQEAVPGTAVTPPELGALILERAGRDIVRSALRKGTPAEGSDKPRLSVAICTKDRADSLARCLASLEALQFAAETGTPQFEILVVDNAPTNSATEELARSRRAVRYVLERRPGLDIARNAAVRAASGDYVAYLDDDVVVDEFWLAGLTQALRENPDAAAITGPVMPMALATYAQVLFEDRGGFSHGFGSARYREQSITTMTYPCTAGMFGAGCNMVFRRDVLCRIGLFDEALDTGAPLPGGGDLDIFYRVLRAGETLVYGPGMAVYHCHRREYRGLRRQMYTWGLGYLAFTMKSHRTDAANRFKLRLAAFASFVYFVQMGALSALGKWKHRWRPDLALWELAGGIKGLAGEYGRSQSRLRAIQSRHS